MWAVSVLLESHKRRLESGGKVTKLQLRRRDRDKDKDNFPYFCIPVLVTSCDPSFELSH